jgi:YggT family protein
MSERLKLHSAKPNFYGMASERTRKTLFYRTKTSKWQAEEKRFVQKNIKNTSRSTRSFILHAGINLCDPFLFLLLPLTKYPINGRFLPLRRSFCMPVGNALIAALFEVVYTILNFYIWVIIVGAALSWLVAFGIINTHSRFVQVVGEMTARITEPLLAPIRRMLPPMGGLDLSPLVLIFAIYFIQSFIRHLVF